MTEQADKVRTYVPPKTTKKGPRLRLYKGPFKRSHIAIGRFTVTDLRVLHEPFIHIAFPTPRPAFVASFGAALIGAVVLVALLL